MQEEVIAFITDTVLKNNRFQKGKGLKLVRKPGWANTGEFRILEGLTTRAKLHYNFQNDYCKLGPNTLWYSDANFEKLVYATTIGFIDQIIHEKAY